MQDVFFDISDDVTWILTSSFIIFTMQSGFGLLESGSCSYKNEVNIMVKNAVDVIIGGLTYWLFGYGLSFGESDWANPFCGWGDFMVQANGTNVGELYSKFLFQASFATTATTIVSGAMAERTKLESYIVFSALNTLIFCIPAHWIWSRHGWLNKFGVIDIAGAGPVHLVGGVTGLVATLILKPRHERFSGSNEPVMGSPSNAILGMFMLWWGWLGFNCGSTFGISGNKWKLAARSAVATIASSVGGGMAGILASLVFKRRRLNISYLINGVLSALVSITAYCAFAQPWEAFVVGAVGALLGLGVTQLLNCLKVDDPVGVVGVHAVGGMWSMLAVGLFTRPDPLRAILTTAVTDTEPHYGAFQGGGFRLLGVQTMAATAIIVWTFVTSFILLHLIRVTVGLRVSAREEKLGADIVEHGVHGFHYDRTTQKLTLRRGAVERRLTNLRGPHQSTLSHPHQISLNHPDDDMSGDVFHDHSHAKHTRYDEENVDDLQCDVAVEEPTQAAPGDQGDTTHCLTSVWARVGAMWSQRDIVRRQPRQDGNLNDSYVITYDEDGNDISLEDLGIYNWPTPGTVVMGPPVAGVARGENVGLAAGVQAGTGAAVGGLGECICSHHPQPVTSRPPNNLVVVNGAQQRAIIRGIDSLGGHCVSTGGTCQPPAYNVGEEGEVRHVSSNQ